LRSYESRELFESVITLWNTIAIITTITTIIIVIIDNIVMDTKRIEVETWVIQVFGVVGMPLPDHLKNHYVEQLLQGGLSFQQVQQEALVLSGKVPPQSQQPQQHPQQPQPQSQNIHPQSTQPNNPGTQEKPKESSQNQTERLKEYVNQLYITYTGRLGDPASTNFLIQSMLDKTYTLTQTEFFVKFSKEAKSYAVKRKDKEEQDKIDKVSQYVVELFRVYLKRIPTDEEKKSHVDAILTGERNLQDTEDELRLMSIESPK